MDGIGERIKNARTKIGLSQKELAEKINVSKQTMYKYECGVIKNIPYKNIEKIAEQCKVSPAYLTGWE